MRYKDVIHFESLESIIQLRQADDKQHALDLVKSYVISERMAEQLTQLLIPNLQIDHPTDNKGVLIVGNYGTGKSHLMSVISALAEHADLVDQLNNQAVQEAAKSIAGQFKVIRTEVGGVTRRLRDILLNVIEMALDDWGIAYQFPAADAVNNNKDAIIEALAEFEKRYPDQGLLLVVDELLDYLRTRQERDLILDLGFLRELGEVTSLTKFRFVAGVQESLFDNPRLAFVADQLRRVRDRFEQIRIAREDIAFVVSNRLLRKNDAQLAQIHQHLRQFTPLYSNLAERIDEFAQMFPIHPAYIDVFEQVHVAEKREILKTFSHAIANLLDKDVPRNQPGLVSFDHYWPILQANTSLRTLSDVREVVDKSDVLLGRIEHAYTRPNLLPLARRIVHALSVHRLTTRDIKAKLGLTPTELRDDLFLFTPMPEQDALFLLNQVQVALREIMRTVSGQFISENPENSQYYLDVDKVIDFDSKITERGQSLGEDELDRYFFDAMRQVLNLSDTTYVTNYRIWLDELPWLSHKVTRPGYIFFGTPDDRSTAQPPYDFYLYIIPPFNAPPNWEKHYHPNPADVIFQLTGLDEDFMALLRHYAGARALSNESVDNRQIYQDKALGFLKKLNRWLRQNLISHLNIRYQDRPQTLSDILAKTPSSASQSIEELLKLLSSQLLAPHFEEKYPHYPTFSRLSDPITESNRQTNVYEAIRYLTNRSQTTLGISILHGLELFDEADQLRPQHSNYAAHFLSLLTQKADPNQVVNRGELIELLHDTGLKRVEKDLTFGLEPEWVGLILLALVYNGDIVLNVDSKTTLDAGNLDSAVLIGADKLADFRHYKRPRNLPLDMWVLIFEGLDLPPALIRDETERKAGLQRLIQTTQNTLQALAKLENQLKQGLSLWGESLFTDTMTLHADKSGVVSNAQSQPSESFSRLDLLPAVRGYKQFLETLSRFNTPGKLRNLRLNRADIAEAMTYRRHVARTEQLLDAVTQLQSPTTYLASAQAYLWEDHRWVLQADDVKRDLLRTLRQWHHLEQPPAVYQLRQPLDTLQSEYMDIYTALHSQMVLTKTEDDRRQKLYNDPRLKALQALSKLDYDLNQQDLAAWQTGITQLPVSLTFRKQVLEDKANHEKFIPARYPRDYDAKHKLTLFDQRLSQLLQNWRQALRSALKSETAQESLNALTDIERTPIDTFLNQLDDDTDIPAGFVTAAMQALRGLKTLPISSTDLLEALKSGGMPCTQDELEKRFRKFLRQAMSGHDSRNTRLYFEQNEE